MAGEGKQQKKTMQDNDCKTFIEKFQEVAESQSTKDEGEDKDSSAAAQHLEKLSVEEKTTEEASKEEDTPSTKEEEKTKEEATKSEDK